MTSFQIISDIHFEHHRDQGVYFFKFTTVCSENIIIAGDVTSNAEHLLEKYLQILSTKFKNVIYVPGNHEFYGGTFKSVDLALRKIHIPNVHILNPGAITIDDVNIIGATLWFPKTKNTQLYKNKLSDFTHIKDIEPSVYQRNLRDSKFIFDTLLKSHTDKNIIVTHHMPSFQLLPIKYIGNPINCYFVCEMLDKNMPLPQYWIYGHSHMYSYNIIQRCNFICNPFGYPHENTHMDEYLVIDL